MLEHTASNKPTSTGVHVVDVAQQKSENASTTQFDIVSYHRLWQHNTYPHHVLMLWKTEAFVVNRALVQQVTSATLPPKEWPQTTRSAEGVTPACESLESKSNHWRVVKSIRAFSFLSQEIYKTHQSANALVCFCHKPNFASYCRTPSNVSKTSMAQDSKLWGEEPEGTTWTTCRAVRKITQKAFLWIRIAMEPGALTSRLWSDFRCSQLLIPTTKPPADSCKTKIEHLRGPCQKICPQTWIKLRRVTLDIYIYMYIHYIIYITLSLDSLDFDVWCITCGRSSMSTMVEL